MKVRYDGPSGNVNRDVGAETGQGDVLEHGCVYDVSDELGEALVSYDASWHDAAGDAIGELTELTRDELNAKAEKAEITAPERFPNKRALAAEISKVKG